MKLKQLYITASLILLAAISMQAQNQQDIQTQIITIGGKSGGEAHKNQLLHAGGLKFIYKDSTGYEVTGFRMTVVKHNAGTTEFTNPQNGMLTEAMREALAGCVAGDKVYFEYISYVRPDGVHLKHTALSFVITGS